MKRIILLLIFFVVGFLTRAQWPSVCTVPDVLRNNYEFDVADLTFKWLHLIHSPDTSLIEIPQWAQEPIWEGLAAIYNRHDIIEIDSLFNKYCVHNALTHSLITQYITISVDTSFTWTRNWAQLQTTTGIPELDSLLAHYGFTVYHYSVWFTNEAHVLLETSQSINVLPLCDSLLSFPGIISARKSGFAGDGNRIEFEYSSDTRFYTFTLAWGDCLSGCTSFHIWKFQVNPDCSVDFLGIENHIGDSHYPEPRNCNLSSDVPHESTVLPMIKIFPNPVTDYLSISTNLTGTISFILVDRLGKKITSGSFEKETTIDPGTQNNGLYFLIIQKDSGSLMTKKILIERR